jgi:uncharacterized protein (DUF885 family)
MSARWLDRFFEAYYSRNPVNATFIGVHDHDARLPDFSDSGAGEALSEMRGLLASAPASDTAPSRIEAVDLRLAAGFLRTRIWEYESRHFHMGNPSLYSGEAVFGVMSLFLTEFAPLEQRVRAAIERLQAIPAFLGQAKANVRSAPPEWTMRAIHECDGALRFLREGVEMLARECGSAGPSLVAAAAVAEAAFIDYRGYLSGDLLDEPDQRIACGDEAFMMYLRDGHLVRESPEDILAYARESLAEAAAELASRAPETLAGLQDLHPTTESYYAHYQAIWDEMRSIAIDRGLLTWPDSPIRYVPRPEWCRSAAPHLYFLFYRSPAAFGRPATHDYLVTPIDASLPRDRQVELLRATNDSVIKLNHVIHHGGIGHHVQNWHAFRSPSRIGRIAAVDCASRIAMFCGGTMAEGWACYATDLMREAGALTPLEELAELQTRARMCARAVVDVLLHTGRLDLAGATAFYQREAGLSAAGARAEAVKNSMFPGAAVMYLLGTDAIHELRREISAARGPEFNLREFHDEFLSFGSIPVSLAGELMRERTTHAE